MNAPKQYTLGKTTTKWFVVFIVLAILGMALWTALTVRNLTNDPEAQEQLQNLKEQL
jgi:predicted negative regulator of RcsB-dependent stress response